MWAAIGLLLLGVLAAVVVYRWQPSWLSPWWSSRSYGPRGEVANGTLLVTGVSPRPNATGEQFVTVAGVIHGPTVNEHATSRQLMVDVGQWPVAGAQFGVIFALKNPDDWVFSSPKPPGKDLGPRIGWYW